jgi:glycosyltransferase involved in cell wall biosynthesis
MMSADRKIGLEILDDEQIAHDSQLIAVAIRPWASDAFVGELAAQLDTLVAAHQARIVFVPFQTSPHRLENDPAMALNVLTHMKHATSASIVRGTYTPEDKMAILAASELVIGMRLHAVIMAAVAGAPVVALAYDPKIINTMTAISADNMVLGLDDLGMLAQKATWAMSETSYRTTLLRGAQVLAEAAAQNAQVFKPAMDRPPRIADPLAIETSAFALRQFESMSAREQVQVASRQLKELTTRHNDLQTKWDELARSRSLRLVNTWWRFRNFLARRRPEETLAEGTRAEFEIALAELLDRHRDTPGMVVFPPTIGWSAHLFQRPHQMARAFARLGYLTFFGVDWGGRDGVSGFEYVEERLCLMALPTAHQSILQAIPAPLMISYVYNFEFRQHLSNPTTVFEHIDHLEVFAPSYPMEKLSAWYDLAIKAADVAAASARDLQEEMLPERPDTVLAPNGVNFEHFAGYRPGPPPSDLEPLLAKPIVGYYGAMAKWLDYELAEHAARSLPDFNFVFIGPNYDDSMKGQPVFDLTNVVWLGTKPYDDLPAYLYRFSVASIPFQVNDVTHRVSPLKLFEYMAGGKPVVTTAMRECQHYSPPVLIAKDGSDWVDRLVEAERLSHDPDFVAILQRTARANTWDERVGTLIDVAARARVR